MSLHWDHYVIVRSRSFRLAERFLDHFLPDRKPAINTEVYRGESLEFKSADEAEVMRYLERHNNVWHRMYWFPECLDQEADDIVCATIAYTEDDHMVLGLSCAEDRFWRCDAKSKKAYWDNDTYSRMSGSIMRKLKLFAGVTVGIRGWELAPPTSMNEFFAKEPGKEIV